MTATAEPVAPAPGSDPGATPTPPRWARLAPYAGFAVLALWHLRAVVAHPRSRIVSNGGDGAVFAWQYAHVWRSLSALENPFDTNAIFWPVGVDLSFHTMTPLPAVLAWPIAVVFGAPFAMNVLSLGAVMAAACVTYWVALRVVGSRGAAFFAGIVFAFCPWLFVHAGTHYNLVFTFVVPLAALAVLRLRERSTAPRAAAVGVVLAVAFTTDFYLFVFSALVVVVLGVAWRRELFGAGWLRRAGALAGAASVLSLPYLVLLVRALLAGDLQRLPGLGESDFFSADALSWFIPPYWHPLWGGKHGRVYALNWGEQLVYLGIVVVVLAYVAVRSGDRSARRGWLALTVWGVVLACGPYLQVAEWTGSLFSYRGARFLVPLPYLVVQQVPVLNGVRVAARFSIVAVLGASVLGALGVAHLARRVPRARYLWAAACVIVLVEFTGGVIPTRAWVAPKAYDVITDDHGGRAVLEVPIFWSMSTHQIGGPCCFDQLQAAAVHGHPIVSGATSRYPERRWRELVATPVYLQVLTLSGVEGADTPATFDAADLRDLGIGWVVFHRDHPQPRVEEYVRGLGLTKVADDGTVVVYEVPRG